MIKHILKTKVQLDATEHVEVFYSLIFENALYSLECYKNRMDNESPNNYCIAENITDDEKEAEEFLSLMANGKVMPVHMNDMVEDYFFN